MMRNRFLDHPRSVGETYSEHLRAAAGFGFPMIGSGVACIIHALLPWLFPHTASSTIRSLYLKMERRGKDDANQGFGRSSDGCDA